jgi:phenylalanyl-tRNA synthetase beta chain
VRRNLHAGREDVALFEVAHLLDDGRRDADDLPHEPWGLAFVLAGRLGGSSWRGPGLPVDVLLAKGVLGAVLDRLGVEWRVEAADLPQAAPGRGARVLVGGEDVGELGELHPHVAARFELDGTVAFAELDLDRAFAHVPARVVARPVPTQPPVLQDLAVVVDASVPSAALVATAREAGAPLLRAVEVFDVFRDPERLGPDRVSVGLRLAFGEEERTLVEAEASAAREAITAALAERHGAELRG